MMMREHRCAGIVAQSKFNLLDLAQLTRYQKIYVVHDDDRAGDKGRAYIARLKAISSRSAMREYWMKFVILYGENSIYRIGLDAMARLDLRLQRIREVINGN